uniref:RNA-directed DNA methylation 4 n=1 Tax=Anisakis simplex TaxID=6269 RepID=A0A0M3JHB9_ANISI
LATVRKRFDELLLVDDSEDDENDSDGGNEEDYVDGYGDDDSVGSLEEFVVKSDEDIVYEQDWDELDEAERVLDEEEVR